MSGIKNQEKLEEVRNRLYERGTQEQIAKSHELSDTKEQVASSWRVPPKPIAKPKPKPEVEAVQEFVPEIQSNDIYETDMAPKKRNNGYRIKILLAGVGFFVLAMAISSLFLIFGGGGISGDNITIAATGPFTVGGGQELQMQVGITNDNAIPIESATLIVEYPNGTQSSTEPGKELFTERLTLDIVNSGETVNIPMRAVVFGEENDEKIVKVSIEYRVQGSNATFFKVAEPLRFKISSSPIIMRADTLKKVSSGQETEVIGRAHV